jgi:error-prone DNA polymerase
MPPLQWPGLSPPCTQIVRDARDHGVEVRPVCVNASRWDCTLEANDDGSHAVRLGMRMVRGLANADAATILAARRDRPFASADDLWRRSGVPVASLVRLAEADAFLSGLGLARREALWAIKALRDEPLPLFAAARSSDEPSLPEIEEPAARLNPMTAGREVVEDYGHLGLTLREHPVTFLRADLLRQGCITCAAAEAMCDGRKVQVAGLVLVRQKPGSAKGVMFITIEDETGVANLVIWPSLFEQQRRIILTATMLGVDGRVQREGEVVHVVVDRLHDLSRALASVGLRDAAYPLPHGRGDEFRHGGSGRDARDLPKPGARPRDIYVPDLSLEAIRVRGRDFR